MLELEKLTFGGIGRFVEEQFIDFSSLSNFAQVDAENKNTGGSSGSGKSTIFNSLDYLLGLSDLPTTVLQSRLTKSPIKVTGLFKLDGLSLEISRSKSGLRIDNNGQITEGSSALAEEKLDQILGMSRELFGKTMHKKQGSSGFFLDFTPKKMHEFLADCQNLGSYKKHLEKIDKELLALNAKLTKHNSDLSSNDMGLRTTQEAITSLGAAPEKPVSKEMILELKEKYDRSAIRFKDVQKKCEEFLEILEKERPNIHVDAYDGIIRENFETRRKEIEAEISSIRETEQKRQQKIKESISEATSRRSEVIHKIDRGSASKEEATRIASEIKQIRDSKCPTCDQHWNTESSKETEQNKLAELSKHKMIIIAASEAAGQKTFLDEKILGLQNHLTPLVDLRLETLNMEFVETTSAIINEKAKAAKHNEEQNVFNQMLLHNFKAKQDALNKSNAIEINQVNGQMDLDRRAFDIAVNSMRFYEETKTRHESSCNILDKKIENFTKSIAECVDEIKSTTECIFFAEELKKAIKMYISYSFDDALEAIGDGATKIIRCIPNMSNATIQFESTKENKDGKIKEEVNAVISMDGEIGIPIKSLSGGERSAIDIAVDLSVIDFIETKTGKGINIFILDEPFSGMDSINVEQILEMLKNSDSKKKILIVDHNEMVKQMIDGKILVTREGTISTVSQL